MVGVEIGHGTAVAHHQVFESPFIAQDLLQQTGVAAAGVVVETLVGAHHFAHLRILHQGLEGRHVGLPQVAGRDVGQVDGVAAPFGSAVHGIMLGAGPEFTVFGVFGTLQTTNHRTAHHTGQIGVLAVGLLASAPTRVAEDVHIGRPYRQTVEFLILTAIEHAVVVLGAELCARGIENAVEQVGVERRGHAHWFGKHRHVAHVGSAMERLAPPEELADAQTGDCRTLVEHQLCFLLDGESAAQVFGPLLGTQTGVLVGVGLAEGAEAASRHQDGNEQLFCHIQISFRVFSSS